MLKGKVDDGIKQVPARNNFFDRLFDIPIEGEAKMGMLKKIFRIDGTGADRVRFIQFVANVFLLSPVKVKNSHVGDIFQRETRKVSTE